MDPINKDAGSVALQQEELPANLPDWVRFAIEASQEIERSGVILPADLAARCKDYPKCGHE
jgi:hypothetical protein